MEMSEIIGKILGALAVGLLAWLTPKLTAWLQANTTAEEEAAIMAAVRSFCRAAEQLLKEDDPTGEKRYAYVLDQLTQLGVEITDAVIAMIEGAVFDINREAAK